MTYIPYTFIVCLERREDKLAEEIKMKKQKDLEETFNKVLSDLYCIDWSETDGSDVRTILKKAFVDWKKDKAEIVLMFEKTATLNRYQKTIILQTLNNVA